MCRAFAALNIRVSSLASCTSPTRSSAIFPLASLTFPFISLSISFFDFLKSLLFSGSLQFLIWSLISFCSFDILSRPGSVVIYFILVSDMCFCRTFDYILELFPFVLFLCCYVFAARRFLLNLLSISFLGLFILCKCLLLTSVAHPLMISSCPFQFCSGNEKSMVLRFFCPSVWTRIGQDFLFLLIQDNVINFIVYWEQ